MPRYAENTTVKRDASLAEIERTLVRYGADAFVYGWGGSQAMVGFQWGPRRYQFAVPMPDPNDEAFTLTPSGKWQRTDKQAKDAYDQAVRQRWRALALFVKATLEAVEAGILSRDDAFLAYTALPGGGTVGQWLAPQLVQALSAGRLPPLLPLADED